MSEQTKRPFLVRDWSEGKPSAATVPDKNDHPSELFLKLQVELSKTGIESRFLHSMLVLPACYIDRVRMRNTIAIRLCDETPPGAMFSVRVWEVMEMDSNGEVETKLTVYASCTPWLFVHRLARMWFIHPLELSTNEKIKLTYDL